MDEFDVSKLTRRELQYLAKELGLCRGNAKSEVILNHLKEYLSTTHNIYEDEEDEENLPPVSGTHHVMELLGLMSEEARKYPKTPVAYSKTPFKKKNTRVCPSSSPSNDVENEKAENKTVRQNLMGLMNETITQEEDMESIYSATSNTAVLASDEEIDQINDEEVQDKEESLDEVVEQVTAELENNDESEQVKKTAHQSVEEVVVENQEVSPVEIDAEVAGNDDVEINNDHGEQQEDVIENESFPESEEITAEREEAVAENEVAIPEKEKLDIEEVVAENEVDTSEKEDVAIKNETEAETTEEQSDNEENEEMDEMVSDDDAANTPLPNKSSEVVMKDLEEGEIDEEKSGEFYEIMALVNSMEELSVVPNEKNPRVRCSLTGHEMKLQKKEIADHLSGKKFALAKQQRECRKLSTYEPMFTPHPQDDGYVWCNVTNVSVKADIAHIEAHMGGQNYQKQIDDWMAQLCTENDNEKLHGIATPKGKKTYFNTPKKTPTQKPTHWTYDDYQNE